MEEGNYAPDKNDPILYGKNIEESRSFYTLGDFLGVCRAFRGSLQYAFCVLSASGDVIPHGESVADPLPAFGGCGDRIFVRAVSL